MSPRIAAAEACAPAAVVAGDPEPAGAVRDMLTALGISETAAAGCPLVSAEVTWRGNGLLIVTVDGYGRRSERLVEGPETAAALIESWTRRDLSEALLVLPESAVAPVPPSAAAGGMPAAGEAVPDDDRIVPADGIDAWSGWAGAAGEATAGSDLSTWFGARLGVCRRLGPACLGGVIRFGWDPGLTGDSEELRTRRVGLDGLLSADFPIEWPRVAVTPGIGLGGGWIRSTGSTGNDENEHEEEDDSGQDDTGQGSDEDDEEVHEDAGGLRVDLHVTIAIAIAAGLSLDLVLSAGLSVFGRYDSYNDDDGSLAGEPRGAARAGLGLGYRF